MFGSIYTYFKTSNNNLGQGSAKFSVNGQIENILGFEKYMVSDATTQL